MRTWSDASGVDRVLAVFLYVEASGSWLYTCVKVPDEIWDQLEARGDHQIGFQEILAPVLTFGTWPHLLNRCSWTAFLDNQGAMHGLLNASCRSFEMNAVAGKFWLELAVRDVIFHALRVESKSNVADGPTRADLTWALRLRAVWFEPVFPVWAKEVWGLSIVQ